MFKSFIKKLNKALRDDSGASLLELIIAVTILAIVTAPLLNTFIVSAKLNAKAKTMGLETDAITSIYEKIKGTDASEIVSAKSDGTLDKKQKYNLRTIFGAEDVAFHNPADVRTSSDGLYKQMCSGVNLDITNLYAGKETSDRKFDANVQMTAVPVGTDGLISVSSYDQGFINTDNNTPRAVQMSFDNVWLQPTDSSDPDEIVNGHLPNKINADSTESTDVIDENPDAKGQRVKKNQRIITVTLETSTSSDGLVRVTPVIKYEYEVDWIQLKEGSKTQLEEKKIYSEDHTEAKPGDSEDIAVYTRRLNEFTYKEAGKTEAEHHFFDVMLFYRPYYYAVKTDTGQYDTINIDNESNLEGDMFIVKEKPDDTKTYSGIIRLIENHPEEKTNFKLNVHTNMGLKSTNDLINDRQSLSGGTFVLKKIYNSNGYYNLSNNLALVDKKYSYNTLIKEEAIDHIYQVTIKLYKAGELSTGNPVCTFSGIKVN